MNKRQSPSFGFLTVGTLWGYLAGFIVLNHMSREANSPDPIKCLVIYPALGVMAGLILDLLFSNRRAGQQVLVFLLISLFLGVAYFFLFFPSWQRVRE